MFPQVYYVCINYATCGTTVVHVVARCMYVWANQYSLVFKIEWPH